MYRNSTGGVSITVDDEDITETNKTEVKVYKDIEVKKDGLNPVYTFQGDNNTGIASAADDRVSIICNGAESLRIGAFGNFTYQTLYFPLSTHLSPSIRFDGSSTSGIYCQSADSNVGICRNSQKLLECGDTYIDCRKNVIIPTNGTAANPNIQFNSATKSGLRQDGSGVMHLVQNSSDSITLNNSNTKVNNLLVIVKQSSPGIAFDGDLGLGIGSNSANLMQFYSNSIIRMTISDTLNDNLQRARFVFGDPSVPGIVFGSSGNNGISCVISPQPRMGFVRGGNELMICGQSLNENNQPVGILDGTVSNPGLCFSSAPSTGIYHQAGANLSFTHLGTRAMSLNSNQMLMATTGVSTGRIYSFFPDNSSGMGLTATSRLVLTTGATERLIVRDTDIRCAPNDFYVNNALLSSSSLNSLTIGPSNNDNLSRFNTNSVLFKTGFGSISGDQLDILRAVSGGGTQDVQYAFHNHSTNNNFINFQLDSVISTMNFMLRNTINQNIRGACIYAQPTSYISGSESCNLVFQTKPSTGPTRDVLMLDNVQQATFNCDFGSSRPIIINATSGSFSNTVMDMVVTRAASSSYWFLICRSSGYGDSEFIVRGDGNVYADGSYTSPAVDYAELFMNFTNGVIPRGTTVVLQDGKVRPATILDLNTKIIGVVRGKNGYNLGGLYDRWHKKYLVDEFGDYILDGKTNERILNPEYNPNSTYVKRNDRLNEWSVIGLVGQIPVKKTAVKNPNWIFMREISDSVDMYLVR